MVAVVGKLQTNIWDKDGIKHTSIDIVVEEQHFAEGRKSTESSPSTSSNVLEQSEWPIPTMQEDDDLLF